ncbi:MAG TPA: helix-turn-helix transcriptional regulator [Actinocrinis sp.]|nr:helix-turn-helix transcriptional regulator [Actinocrinis sp.]HEV3169886.1 helix-turn-helix transcriptional regulator [Actinocrinis sp.]
MRRCAPAPAAAWSSTRTRATWCGPSEREREIVALAAHGLTNDEIAAELVLSPATVRTHVSGPWSSCVPATARNWSCSPTSPGWYVRRRSRKCRSASDEASPG